MGRIWGILALLLVSNSAFSGGTSTRILVIGDSHTVGPFGHLLDSELREKVSALTATYGSCGSIAGSWFKHWKTPCGYFEHVLDATPIEQKTGRTPLLIDLLQRHQPDLVIVELSGNYVNGYERENAIIDMRRIGTLLKSKGMPCLWTSAPDGRHYPEVRAQLFSWVNEAVGDHCRLVNALPLTHYPETGGDGTHYSKPEQVLAWVEAVLHETMLMLNPGVY